jgi:hypothetical protein
LRSSSAWRPGALGIHNKQYWNVNKGSEVLAQFVDQ